MVQLQTEQYPTAHITVNRNRVKNYDSNVYLKDGTNYEIELWNPLTTKVLVNITVDNKVIAESGIILNPGQRVYLERWIDTPRKLKFSTYSVKNSPEAKHAIRENGKILVSFYHEIVKTFYPSNCSGIITTLPWSFQSRFYASNTMPSKFGEDSTINYYCSTKSINIPTNLETGRTEMGEGSRQVLVKASGEFNSWVFKTIEWRILPESSKPVEVDKIRAYCMRCGTRIRTGSWKFCPSCGGRLD